ncbi:hypothetical protein AUO95_03445 [Corynebacterium glutamicum]|nr:hypothetical protein [Corynebacterium glutamicum]OKX84251.1 hypothetical protein AUO95_03445 [Corynebacterium glutamicum]
MDDDVVDVALFFFKVTQQGFESWAVSACAGDSSFNEFFGHYCAQALSLLPVGISLGWNGEAFRLPTLAGLLAGRNSEVRDCSLGGHAFCEGSHGVEVGHYFSFL